MEPLSFRRPSLRGQSPTGPVLSSYLVGAADAGHAGAGCDHRAPYLAGRGRDVSLAALRGSVGERRFARRCHLRFQRLLLRACLRRALGRHHHLRLATAHTLALPLRRQRGKTSRREILETGRRRGAARRPLDPGGAHGLLHLRRAGLGRLRTVLRLAKLAQWKPRLATLAAANTDARHGNSPGRRADSPADGADGTLDKTGHGQLRFRGSLLLAARLPADAAGTQFLRRTGAHRLLGRRALR